MPIPTEPTNYVPRPFADQGAYADIPDAASTTRASYTSGFPTATQLPKRQGGVAPNRLDFNGLFRILTAALFWQQSGGQWSYDVTLNYSIPSFVFHNNILWWCVQQNGPETTAGAIEPGTNTAYWNDLLTILSEMSINNGNKGLVSAIEGEIRLLPFRPTELPESWYFCNGTRYATGTPQATVLSQLPTNYRTDWGVTTTSAGTNVPNLIADTSTGDGYFIRPTNGTTRRPGNVQEGQLLYHRHHITASTAGSTSGGGAVPGVYNTGSESGGYTDYAGEQGATDNRPTNIAMTPAIYLGV